MPPEGDGPWVTGLIRADHVSKWCSSKTRVGRALHYYIAVSDTACAVYVRGRSAITCTSRSSLWALGAACGFLRGQVEWLWAELKGPRRTHEQPWVIAVKELSWLQGKKGNLALNSSYSPSPHWVRKFHFFSPPTPVFPPGRLRSLAK